MKEIICPSGLSGRIRKLKLKEGRILTDANLEARGRLVEELVDSCWIETLDPGPYDFKDRPDWGRVLQGDRFYALMEVAIATYGDDYDFHTTCESCRKRIDWRADLSALDVIEYPDETLDAFTNGNRFTATALDGTPVVFRLLVGDDEQVIAQWMNQGKGDILERRFRKQIVSVEGVEDTKIDEWVAELDMDVHEDLLEQFEEVNGGVETEIEIRCTRMTCGVEQMVELPFGIELLLRTGGGKRRRKRRKGRVRPRSSR